MKCSTPSANPVRLTRVAAALLLVSTLSYTSAASAAFQFRMPAVGLTPSASALPAPEDPRYTLSIDTAALDFGVVATGSTLQRQVALLNTGNRPVTITGATGPAGYTVSSNCTTLQPGAQCTLTITFAPTATQAYPGTLSLATQEVLAVPVVTLSGSGNRVLAGTGTKLVTAQVVGMTASSTGSLLFLTSTQLKRIDGVNQTTTLSNTPSTPSGCSSVNALTALTYNPVDNTYYVGGSCNASSSGYARAALWSVKTLGNTPTSVASWGTSTNNNTITSFAIGASRLYMGFSSTAGVNATSAYSPSTGGAFSWNAMSGATVASLAFNADPNATNIYAIGFSGNLLRYNGTAWAAVTTKVLSGSSNNNAANSLAVSSDGSLYLFNSQAASLHKYTSSGEPLQSWALSNVQAYNGSSTLVLVSDIPYVSNNYGVWRID